MRHRLTTRVSLHHGRVLTLAVVGASDDGRLLPHPRLGLIGISKVLMGLQGVLQILPALEGLAFKGFPPAIQLP